MDRWVAQSELAGLTGMVVPAYFSAKPSDDLVRHLLWMTLGDCHHYLPLDNVWVVVDGDARTARLLGEVKDHLLATQGASFNLLPLPQNRGKLAAMRAGMSALLEANPRVEYVVVRDSDGDHVISALPALVRAGVYLADVYQSTRVIGSRRSRHRPMGWIRGELEGLLDRITMECLAYHLARENRALDLRHCSGESIPDLSNGYKVYGRQVALDLFVESEPQMACLSSDEYWHYGPETVTVVEATLKGAVMAESQRPTWDGQPATSFGEFQALSLYGGLLAWVGMRLQIPLGVMAQFYDNHVPAMPLRTTAQGRELLVSLRAHVLERMAASRGRAEAIPEPKPILPFL